MSVPEKTYVAYPAQGLPSPPVPLGLDQTQKQLLFAKIQNASNLLEELPLAL